MTLPFRTGIPACHFYLNSKMDSNYLSIQNRHSCLSLLLQEGQTGMSVLLVINDPGKTFGLEACATDQCTINVRLRHQAGNIIGLH